MSAPVIFITTLAEYQTVFWLEVAAELKRTGAQVRFISFDDRSTEAIGDAGFRVHACAKDALVRPIDPVALDTLCKRLGIRHFNRWLAHERITFAIRDSGALAARFAAYVEMVEQAFSEAAVEAAAEGARPVLVQELGGFVSVVASYFAARARGVDNWFIEPSFFRGRQFFIRNSFAAKRIALDPTAEPSPAVREYLANTLDTRAIVIPLKDRHHYTSVARKIVNRRNVKRLFEKVVDKHLHGKHQEFGHIGHHVSQHTRMLVNSMRTRSLARPLEGIGRFVYYPLHVPADMALTLRSPQFLDQLALVDYIARSIPTTHKLAIKEHPAQIGALPAERLAGLLERYDNVVLLTPQTNNFHVLQATDAVVSVNSKSGAEAMLLGKPVLVIGDAFYRDAPLVTRVERLDDLPALIEAAVAGERRVSPEDPAIGRYFESVWRETLPGELYSSAPQNVVSFARSVIEVLRAPLAVAA